MNTIPLQTYCVGRLLVDLPQKGTQIWTQEFDDSKVSRLPNSIQSSDQFWSVVEKRRNELAKAPHDTEQHLLHLYKKVDTVSAILLFRESDFDVYGYNIERYVWLGTRGYLMKSGIGNEYVKSLEPLTKIFTQLSPIDNRESPSQPGFCIDGALVTGDVGKISAGPSVDVPGWKGVRLSMGTSESFSDQTNSPPSSAYGDLEQEQRVIRETPKIEPGWLNDPTYPKEFTVLRKRERSLNGIPGQEVVFRKTFNDGKHEYKFLWEDTVPLTARTPPKGNLQLEFIDEQDSNKPGYPPPPEDQMFALWDAVLDSVKARH